MPQVPTAPRSYLLLADTPNAVGWARRHTRDMLTRWRMPPDLTDKVLVVVSELATNAVQHPGSKQPERLTSAELSKVHAFGLDLHLNGQAILVQVADRDPRPPVLQHVSEDAQSGRGIFLVEEMSSQWGFYYPPSGGKVVWAELTPSTQEPPAEPSTAVPRPVSNRAGRAKPLQPLTNEQLRLDDPLLMGRVLVGLREL
ncbi:ATP-binding protein [Kitasatospora sp. NPDC049285]|uniref:ATP-binding protein n=1 Tax=Kitasatospora sp. NPDC049285 TaxID=3157096 RepID=UPI003430789F